MNDENNGGLLGRVTALALILAAVYGVRAVARGELSCPLGVYCPMGGHESAAPAAPAAEDTLANPDAPKNIPVETVPAKK